MFICAHVTLGTSVQQEDIRVEPSGGPDWDLYERGQATGDDKPSEKGHPVCYDTICFPDEKLVNLHKLCQCKLYISL